jgi:Hepatocellular carcinoma-associated antigen 59
MAYIEENIQKRKGDTATIPKKDEGPRDPYEELYNVTGRFNGQKSPEEDNVTNSLAMLTAIPEVDLGME